MIKRWIIGLILLMSIGTNIVYGINQEENKVTISLIGDVLLDRSIGNLIDQQGADYPWVKVAPILKNKDVVLGNLETSVGLGGAPLANKQYTFQSKPHTLTGFREVGIKGVAIANNHTLDYGQEGFIETLENLEKMEIRYAGGGRNITEALTPIVWEIKDLKIGFLAFSRVIYDVNWYATEKRPGILSGYDGNVEQVSKLIEKTKEEVDFLIVSIHWGTELTYYPEKDEIKFGKMMIDSGADVIMGHHPHVLQGVEFYKNKPIVYSLGNFVFNSRGKASNQTMIFNIDVNKNGIVGTQIVPIAIKAGQPTPAEGEEKEDILNHLNTVSQQWNTQFMKNGDIVGNIQYAPPLLEKQIEDLGREKEAEDEEKISIIEEGKPQQITKFFGYTYHYQFKEMITTLIKKDSVIYIDHGRQRLTIEQKKTNLLERIFLHGPLRVLSKLYGWTFERQK